jgi:hypothetical protein
VGIVHTPDSEWAKEATKWEANYTVMGEGKRPYVKRDYPMMMYKAGNPPGGGIGILDTEIVMHEAQRTRQRQMGFRDTPLEAIEAFEEEQTEYARLAAEREYEKKNKLSPKARAEVQAHEDEASGHLPTIPETPIKRRGGRPKKVAV